MELVDFLRARLDDDERIAQGTRQPSTSWHNFDMDGELRDDFNAGTVAYTPYPETRAHIARHDPARVLAEVEAERQVVKLHTRLPLGEFCMTCDAPLGVPGTPYGCSTLRLLAVPYADHPDYREEWRP